MTRDYVVWHLREAAEELAGTIAELDGDPEYSAAELSVAMTHLYHHLNTAWNARDASGEEITLCSHSDFVKWRQFPTDIDLTARDD